MRPEVDWWLQTARRDLELARKASEIGHHEGAAFHSQQAAEKAVKALLLARASAWRRTHSCVVLLLSLAAEGLDVPDAVTHAARELDRHYIDARYPNGVGGAPATFYDPQTAAEAIAQAETILGFVEAAIGS